MIAESLAGKRIAITGSTGFVGTALVERLLRRVPDCSLVLLVRDGKRTSAAERVRKELLKNDAFDRLREAAKQPDSVPYREGETFDQMTARRIMTINGDVGSDGLGLSADDRAVLASCDVVIHSAATVSFDSPLDSAVEINLLGPTRIVNLLNELGVTPHLVSVSTCYVAGNRRGTAPEELVGAGRARAASVGWPDAYAFTKALGEQALTDSKGPVPVSIVRPSIIESSLAEPFPGWIRGFRMAEPVLISYARGLLREFPGVPEGVVDVIPVDLVVAAIITVAALGPEKAPAICQVASGGVNP